MAALVDFTAAKPVVSTLTPVPAGVTIPITPTLPCIITWPVAAKSPHQGTVKDFCQKIALDFSILPLTADDVCLFYKIPKRMYIFDITTVVRKADTLGAAALTISDTDGDDDDAWIGDTPLDASPVDTVNRTLVADTNGATRGKFYPSGGYLYLSSEITLTTLKLDVIVHGIMLD